MLNHIAMLEGAAEQRALDAPRGEGVVQWPRAAAVVRAKLQEARLAEMELQRVLGVSPTEIALAVDAGFERGRHGRAVELVGMAL